MFVALGFIIGTILGSACYASATRIINGESLGGRSYCPHCHQTLAAGDLIPLVSYLLLRGRCRYCHQPISYEYLVTEVVVGLLIALLFSLTIPTTLLLGLKLAFQSYLIVVLVAVFLTDLKTGLIYDRLTYPAIALSLVYLLLSSIVGGIWLPLLWNIVSTLTLAVIFAWLIILTKGRGMGWGDVKYTAFLGLALGFPNNLVAVFLAYLVGAIFALFLVLSGKKRFGQTIPFGPFLSLGAVIALFWGKEMIDWYLNLLIF